ncbi:MAG: putative glycolipid-binding domain-containing protein [bacterium]
MDQTILWRRLDRPGHESARLSFQRSHWHLAGTVVFAHDQLPCRLDYSILCNSHWQTLSARVARDGWETRPLSSSFQSILLSTGD